MLPFIGRVGRIYFSLLPALIILLSWTGIAMAVPEPSGSNEKISSAVRLNENSLTAAELAEIKEYIKGEIENEVKSDLKKEMIGEIKAELKEKILSEAKAEKAGESERFKKNNGRLRIWGYTQIRYADDNTPGSSGASFNASKTRLTLNNRIDEKLSFNVQTNMSGNTVATATSSQDCKMSLMDALIIYRPTPDWEIITGQFGPPFGLESVIGSKKIFLINGTMVGTNSQHEVLGDDQRDLGVLLKYGRKGNPFEYSMSVTNGEGINRKSDSNDAKDITARIVYAPALSWQLGVAGQSGRRYKPASAANPVYGPSKAAATGAGDFKRDKIGIEARYQKERWFWQGEYQWLKTGMPGRISDLVGRGGYVECGYRFRPKLEIGLKEDVFQWDISNSAGNSTFKTHVAGLNWYFDKMVKWQFVYENREETPSIGNDRFYSQIQFEY